VKIVYFVHAIASCCNNGNAHFLRGIGSELQRRGHDVRMGCLNLFAGSGRAARIRLLRQLGTRQSPSSFRNFIAVPSAEIREWLHEGFEFRPRVCAEPLQALWNRCDIELRRIESCRQFVPV
jgi:UDP:flavonoid glycosyltransferase YjiC (YdhE family)